MLPEMLKPLLQDIEHFILLVTSSYEDIYYVINMNLVIISYVLHYLLNFLNFDFLYVFIFQTKIAAFGY